MQGIVLLVALFFLVLIKATRKNNLKLVNKKIIFEIISILAFLMFGCIVYLFFTQSTYMYVRESAVKYLFSDQAIGEETNRTEILISDNINDANQAGEKSFLLNDILLCIWDNRDIILTILGIFICLIIYFFRDRVIFIPYCNYLKNQLYALSHSWLNEKSLSNILVSVNVWKDDRRNEQDICKFFSKEFTTAIPDKYMILGNPGEGKTISIRKIGNMLLDRGEALLNKKKQPLFSYLRGKWVKLKKTGYLPVIFNAVDIKTINNSEELEEEVKKTICSKSKILKIIRKMNMVKKNMYHLIEINMDRGKVVFFFDGLDEISEADSFKLKGIVNKLQEKFPKCFFIFSSRTTVFYERSDLELKKENILHLLPFSKEKILMFLQKWEFNDESACWDLYGKILYSYQLERLASNPLLLTLIAYLYEHTELVEPKSITDFYQKAMNCLLDKWEKEKRILKRTKIDLDVKFALLERIAKWLFENEETFFQKTDVFKESLDLNQYGYSLNSIFVEIYRYSGILEITKQGYYKFCHRSFYEFFLASYLVKNKIDVINLPKYKSNSQIMFFYLSLNGDSKITERYIHENLNDDSLIDNIILECKVENAGIIRYYLFKKKESRRRNIEGYYSVVGWLAGKYAYLEKQIYRDLLSDLDDAVMGNHERQIVCILQAFSRFINPTEVARLIEYYINDINIYNLVKDCSMQLEPCIINLFCRIIDKKIKGRIISGLCAARKYNTILQILKKRHSDEEVDIIFYELLFETKDKLFINWFNEQDFWKYINEEVVNQVEKWEKRYGWRWQPDNIDLRRKRYLMVYYLLNNNAGYKHNSTRNYKISNRIKFVASYIKNQENVYDEIQPFFVDIKKYQIISIDEFRIHWAKTKLKESILFNPTVINLIQWGATFLVLAILCMYFLEFRNHAEIFKDYLYMQLQHTWETNPDLYNQIARQIRFDNLYNVTVSEYLTLNTHLFIFYVLWIIFQIKTYKELIYIPFSRKVIALYIIIMFGYIFGYMKIFSDMFFRLGGIILAFIMVIFAIIQHRSNMPSFRQPQFGKIRDYLDKDIF